MEFSTFGRRFTRPTGARELMEDLGAAMASDAPVMMLGGGNPAHIPEMLTVFRDHFRAVIADEREFRRMVADYPDPAGEQAFRHALAALLREEYGWPVGPQNVTLTAGSQNGFFLLFNMLAGPHEDGTVRKILLPLTPEYIGYTDLGVSGDLFLARRPCIEHLPDRFFKYHVDAEAPPPDGPIAAICASRPTNPSGNVLTDEEVAGLRVLARDQRVPLILDCAYGMPFPGIVFTTASPVWDEDIILCLSLSKLGLPGVRTGIIIAREEVIEAIGAMNAVTNLAVTSVGAVLMRGLVENRELLRLSREVIRPFYERRASQAVDWLQQALRGCEYHIHRPEGALFLWLWLPELTISSAELYRVLKSRGVMVLSGHHFFPGLGDDPWPHRDQCLRLSYTQDEQAVRRGIELLGEEVRRVHRG